MERMQAVSKSVRTLYAKHRGKGTAPTCAEYLDLLQSLAKECSEVYIVIDALDECIDERGRITWNGLLTNLKNSVFNLRLLYTSRQIDNIAGLLTGSTCIKIYGKDADIRAYVRAEVQSRDYLPDFCKEEPTLEDDILQAVVSKAEGMYVLAYPIPTVLQLLLIHTQGFWLRDSILNS